MLTSSPCSLLTFPINMDYYSAVLTNMLTNPLFFLIPQPSIWLPKQPLSVYKICFQMCTYLSLFLPRNHNKLTLKHLEASGIYLCHKSSRLKSAYFTSGQSSIKTKISTLHLRTCSIRFHILALQSQCNINHTDVHPTCLSWLNNWKE